MSAAIEAAIEGIPAIGFSLCEFGAEIEFGHGEPYIKQIAQTILDKWSTSWSSFECKYSSEIRRGN